MGAIAEIFKRYGNDYIETFKGKMPYAHIKAIRTIKRCRTIRSGINFYKCRSCKDQQYIYRACGSRNCPNCQQYKTEEWLQKAEADLAKLNLEKLDLNNDFESLRWFLLPSEAHAQACAVGK